MEVGQTPRQRLHAIVICVAVVFFVVLAERAAAATLPKATYDQGISVVTCGGTKNAQSSRPGNITRSVGGSCSGKPAGTASSTQTIATLPYPRASSTGSISGGGEKTDGYSTINYSFQLVGPPAQSIPVIVTISGSLSSTNAGASFISAGIDSSLVQYACTTAGGSSVCGAFSKQIPIGVIACRKISPSCAESVQLQTTTEFEGNGTAASSLTASVAIDPSFSGASSYKIVFSKGIGNGNSASLYAR